MKGGKENKMSTQQFEQYYNKYCDLIYRISFTYLKNQTDAEDIVQEVFTKLLTCKKEFESDEHIKRWLIRVAVNACKSHIGSFWNRNREYLDNADEPVYQNSDTKNTELWEEVSNLPEKSRITLYLYYFEGYSCKEISQMLRCGESAVKMRLRRGKEMLKIRLTGGAFDEKGTI